MKIKYIVIYFLIAIVFVVSLFSVFVCQDNSKIISVFSLVGTFASLVGIIVAYQQILSVKETSEKIQTEVTKSLSEINEFLSFSDITIIAERISEIHNYVLTDRIEPALLRMKDLKIELISIQVNRKLNVLVELDKLNDVIRDINLDISSFHDFLLKGKKVDLSMVNKHLESTSTILEEIKSKMRNKRYDTK